MTEPVIINNVDVSGCEFYYDGYCTLFREECRDYSDCYYKLLRKPEECNELNNKLQIATEALEKVIKCQEGLPTAKRIAHTTLERIKE